MVTKTTPQTLEAILAALTAQQNRDYVAYCQKNNLLVNAASAKKFYDEITKANERAAELARKQENLQELARLSKVAEDAIAAAERFAISKGLVFRFAPFEAIREEYDGWTGSSC